MRAVKCEKCGEWIMASDVSCRHCNHTWLNDCIVDPKGIDLMSVEDHNLLLSKGKKAHMTDVSCPECSNRLKWTGGMALMSDPPKYPVECKCGWSGHIL